MQLIRWCAGALLGAVTLQSCVCNCRPFVDTTAPVCLGADGGVFVEATSEFGPPLCTGTVDGGLIVFTFTDTYCTHLLGESFPSLFPCDVSSVPPGDYTSAPDVFGHSFTFAMPAVPDGGLPNCR